MLNRRLVVLIAAALFVIFAAGFSLLLYQRLYPPYEGIASGYTDGGTSYYFRAFGKDAQNALDAASERVQSIENIVQGQPGSDVANLNEMAGQLIDVDPATIYLLHMGLTYNGKTLGRFSICDVNARRAYGMLGGAPDQAKISNLVGDPGMEGLSIHYADLQAGISEGTELSLDSMLSAYQLDQAASIVKDYGVQSAYFTIGSEAVAIGAQPGGSWWTFQVPHPTYKTGGTLGVLLLKDQAVATIGAFQGTIELEGETLPAVIDATAMQPVKGKVKAVTVVAKNTVEATAFARALMGMGLQESEALLNALSGAGAVIVFDDNTVYVTRSLAEQFSLRSEEFSLAN